MIGDDLPTGTICGVLREIFSKTDDPEVKLLVRIAVSQAKKIVDKLQKYHNEAA